MENIFKDAHFGKAYRTKDNTIVKFILQDKDFIILYIPKCKYSVETTHRYNSKGEFYLGNGEYGHSALDIVSEWQEPIDEEELDELSMIKYPCNCSLDETYCDCCIIPDLKEAFKAGYRKALIK